MVNLKGEKKKKRRKEKNYNLGVTDGLQTLPFFFLFFPQPVPGNKISALCLFHPKLVRATKPWVRDEKVGWGLGVGPAVLGKRHDRFHLRGLPIPTGISCLWVLEKSRALWHSTCSFVGGREIGWFSMKGGVPSSLWYFFLHEEL